MSTLEALDDLRKNLRMYLSQPMEDGHFQERQMIDREKKRLEKVLTLEDYLASLELVDISLFPDTDAGREQKAKHLSDIERCKEQAADPERQKRIKKAIACLEEDRQHCAGRLDGRANYLCIIPAREVLQRLDGNYVLANIFYQMLRADSLLTYETLLIQYLSSLDSHIASIGEGAIEAAAGLYGLQSDTIAKTVTSRVFKEFIDEVESLSGIHRLAVFICACPHLDQTLDYATRRRMGASRDFDSFLPLAQLSKGSKEVNYTRLAKEPILKPLDFPDENNKRRRTAEPQSEEEEEEEEASVSATDEPPQETFKEWLERQSASIVEKPTGFSSNWGDEKLFLSRKDTE